MKPIWSQWGLCNCHGYYVWIWLKRFSVNSHGPGARRWRSCQPVGAVRYADAVVHFSSEPWNASSLLLLGMMCAAIYTYMPRLSVEVTLLPKTPLRFYSRPRQWIRTLEVATDIYVPDAKLLIVLKTKLEGFEVDVSRLDSRRTRIIV